ncbi:MAG: hypothetical protein AAF211_11295 [Myxococcota bacterium]
MRTGRAELPPDSGMHEVFASEAHAAAWRVVELSTRSGQPFEVALDWSSAGLGAGARLTVANATRVCVHARSLAVRARTFGKVPNRVTALVLDGQVPTANQWEVRETFTGNEPRKVIAVPPFATTVRLDVAGELEPDVAPELQLGGPASLVARVPLVGQPDRGVPVGSASVVIVPAVPRAPQLPFRLLFHLSL